MYRYFPSCNFNVDSPKSAKELRAYLKESMPVGVCCRFDKTAFNQDDKAIIVCQACREVLQEKVDVISLYEYLDQETDFQFPDYHGIRMNLQDCYRDREHSEVHEAVRNVLKKMNIEVVEIENNKDKADFCGTLHYVAKSDDLKVYNGKKISELPIEIQTALMQEQVSKYTCEYVIVDCNRCKKGILLGGGKPIHIIDLILGNADI